MNRHFIFNALNSIQYYINTHDRLAANKYLTSFAKLIRKNLESANAHNNLTSLKSEIEQVQLYLSLEAMRFPDKITYDINISPDLNTETISVPPMFFQPYIENSIWHGILPKEKGHVQIDIRKNDGNMLYIKIEDDGIGVSESKKQNENRKHDSRGVEMTKRRIDLLEKSINKKIEVIGPQDVLSPENSIVGTRVEIILPLENETLL
jgi:sensor histidine kinase YesM